MDKWLDHPWVLKGVSLLIAVLLFLLVNAESSSGPSGGIPGITAGTRVIEDVPLTIYYDEDNQIVTEAPESVQVTLTGPQNLITILLLERTDYELYVDMRGREAGTHFEQVRSRGFPSDLTVSVLPSTVKVTIEEIQTVTYPVELVLLNEEEIHEGYSLGTPTINPNSVTITAASSVINAIEAVRAYVDVSGMNKTFNNVVDISIYDANDDEMEVEASPSSIEVNIPVASPNKEVSLNMEREGRLPTGVAIESITIEPTAVSVYGPLDIINDIREIDLPPLNLGEITESVELEVTVPLPPGVERVAPEKVTVDVQVITEETKEINDVDIEVTGLSREFAYELIQPERAMIDFEIVGSADVLENVDKESFEVYIDVEGLAVGEHELPIRFNSPQNIRIKNSNLTAVIRIYHSDEDISEDREEREEENT